MAARCQIELQHPDARSAFQDPAALLDGIEEGAHTHSIYHDTVSRVLEGLGLPMQRVEADTIDTRVHDALPVRLVLDS